MPSARQSLERFCGWFQDFCLPFWTASGYDHKQGGFFESLDFTGSPILGQPRRVRVQARQVHTFSQSALKGLSSEGEELAVKGFDYILKTACPDDGARGCVHTISDDGSILDDTRDLYDQAFLLLSCASRYEAAGDPRALELANRTIAFMDRELASDFGGWDENDRHDLPRRQNPHMHLLEAFMALHRVTGDERYSAYSKKIINLFNNAFLDQQRGVVREFFDKTLNSYDSRSGNFIEPGHNMEWIWLLRVYDRQFGSNHRGVMMQLYSHAKELGIDEDGFVVDRVQLGCNTGGGARRLWPQCEFLKAALSLVSTTNPRAAENAGDLADRLFNSYLDQKTPGLWCDQYDGEGNPQAKDVPASILYHLFEASVETASYLALTDRP